MSISRVGFAKKHPCKRARGIHLQGQKNLNVFTFGSDVVSTFRTLKECGLLALTNLATAGKTPAQIDKIAEQTLKALHKSMATVPAVEAVQAPREIAKNGWQRLS
eukprot:2274653-Amphidinium_carterae.1